MHIMDYTDFRACFSHDSLKKLIICYLQISLDEKVSSLVQIYWSLFSSHGQFTCQIDSCCLQRRLGPKEEVDTLAFEGGSVESKEVVPANKHSVALFVQRPLSVFSTKFTSY